MRRLIAVCAVAVLVATSYSHAGTPSFQSLDDNIMKITGVSSDGSVVVGTIGSPVLGIQAFRWTKATGAVCLGYLDGGVMSSAAGVSSDGSIVVGNCTFSGPVFHPNEAFRWTSTGGMVSLGGLTENYWLSSANGISSNGSVVVGTTSSTPDEQQAFRWTSSGGMKGLGYLPGGTISSVKGVSSDGLVVIGNANSDSGQQAFRWTSSDGMVGLGRFTDGLVSSATGVSSDGSVVVGSCTFSYPTHPCEAFRWTVDGGMAGLGVLPAYNSASEAYGVSADGSVVVGYSASSYTNEAFIWDAVNGMQDLKDVLVNKCGLNLTGWTLVNASGISADGSTIIGRGVSPDGIPQYWVATIPEPTTLLLLGLGGLMLRKRS